MNLFVAHYYEGRLIGDTDNIVRPIQNAMEHVVYANDRQVIDITAKRRSLDRRPTVRGVSLVLAHALAAGGEFVHIRVELAPARKGRG